MALSADNRLRRPTQFKNVLQQANRTGGRAADHLLSVAGIPNESSCSRIGLSVSKRVGGAVTRNRVKRRLRAIFRELAVSANRLEASQTGWDFVTSARPQAAEATYEELRGSADKLIKRVKARRNR